jgi:hypothetical protein
VGPFFSSAFGTDFLTSSGSFFRFSGFFTTPAASSAFRASPVFTSTTGRQALSNARYFCGQCLPRSFPSFSSRFG